MSTSSVTKSVRIMLRQACLDCHQNDQSTIDLTKTNHLAWYQVSLPRVKPLWGLSTSRPYRLCFRKSNKRIIYQRRFLRLIETEMISPLSLTDYLRNLRIWSLPAKEARILVYYLLWVSHLCNTPLNLIQRLLRSDCSAHKYNSSSRCLLQRSIVLKNLRSTLWRCICNLMQSSELSNQS